MIRDKSYLKWPLILATVFPLSACITTQETKLASAQYKSAIESYSRNIQAFEDAWRDELERAIADLGDALVARAVTLRIDQLSNESDGFSNAAWRNKIANRGLIALSEEIEAEQARATQFLGVIKKYPVSSNMDVDAHLESVIREFNDEARSAIENAPDAIIPPQEKARLLAELDIGPFGDDKVANAIVKTLIITQKSKKDIPKDLGNLKTVVNALREAHAAVDWWIQTDVTVPGDDVAKLINTWSDQLEEK